MSSSSINGVLGDQLGLREFSSRTCIDVWKSRRRPGNLPVVIVKGEEKRHGGNCRFLAAPFLLLEKQKTDISTHQSRTVRKPDLIKGTNQHLIAPQLADSTLPWRVR